MADTLPIKRRVPLSRLTSLRLGGDAEYLVSASSAKLAVEALDFAAKRQMPVTILGGGSNVVIADEGIAGLVIVMRQRGRSERQTGAQLFVNVAAGESWDELVRWSVQRGLGGIECLAGIPGTVGAAPVQNIGAYGQELSSVVDSVIAYDRSTHTSVKLDAAACGFAYRSSCFKAQPDRYLILRVNLMLQRDAAPTLAYAELAREVAERVGAAPTLAQVRRVVLELRGNKGMLLGDQGQGFKSVGSFFTNPVVTRANALAVEQAARAAGVLAPQETMPRWPVADGRCKLSAGWLIERAGLARGLTQGRVGISPKHALSLIHHGGGDTRSLIQLARHVQYRVARRFDIWLEAEPCMLGFPSPPLAPPAEGYASGVGSGSASLPSP